MPSLTTGDEMFFIGLFLEGFFYGLYSAIFTMYLRHQASKKDTNKSQKIIFYSICVLYILCIALFVCDISTFLITYYLPVDKPIILIFRIYFIQTTSFGCCDFIAQFILIYRCWIVWGRNIRVVIIPSILTFAFLATWLACSDSQYLLLDQIINPRWGTPMIYTSLGLSLTVNALVTGLIVFRIFKVFQEVKATSEDQILGVTGGGKLRRVIFILIESGMALFSIQLIRLLTTVVWTGAAMRAYDVIVTIHQMLNGITPTIIVVRTSMGLSFDDEKSMEEVAIGSLHFASNHLPETGSIGNISQGSRNDDDIGIQSNDIEVVER